MTINNDIAPIIYFNIFHEFFFFLYDMLDGFNFSAFCFVKSIDLIIY